MKDSDIQPYAERPHNDHVHVNCFVCEWAHVKGRDCEYACYA